MKCFRNVVTAVMCETFQLIFELQVPRQSFVIMATLFLVEEQMLVCKQSLIPLLYKMMLFSFIFPSERRQSFVLASHLKGSASNSKAFLTCLTVLSLILCLKSPESDLSNRATQNLAPLLITSVQQAAFNTATCDSLLPANSIRMHRDCEVHYTAPTYSACISCSFPNGFTLELNNSLFTFAPCDLFNNNSANFDNSLPLHITKQ